MRNLVLALILANLAFAAWHNWFADDVWPFRQPDGDDPGITLMEEVEGVESVIGEDPEPQQLDEAAQVELLEPALDFSTPAALPAEPLPEQCFSIGPFTSSELAANVDAALDEIGFGLIERQGVSEVWIGQWVYIDTIPTQAEANDIANEFRAAGVTEAYVIAEADNGNLVSLGVFTEPARTQLRVSEARELEYEPTVADRTQAEQVVWLDGTADDAGLAQIADALAGFDVDLLIGPEGCLPIADAE